MSIGRIIRLAIIGWIVGMVAGMVTALTVKRRIVPTTDEAAEEVELAAIFGPLAFHSTAPAFRGGLLEAWYGAGVIDLRDATLAPEGATLRVRAIFAGAQIIVPADWKVVSRVSGMGGLTDMREAKGDAVDAPELVVEGSVFAGGIAVQSEIDEDTPAWVGKAGWGPGERSGWSQRRRMGFGQGWKQDATAAVSEASDAAHQLADDSTDAADAAKDTISEAADTAKDTVTDAASSVADAAADAADAAESEMAPAT